MTFFPDPDPATRHALTHPKDKGAPPHWLRCAHITVDNRRCLKPDAHQGDHEFLKPDAPDAIR